MKRKSPPAQPFDWLISPRPARNPNARRPSMYLEELRARAALLRRLAFSAPDAKARLRASVLWDFELHGAPPFVSKIDSIVDEVYRRGGAPGGTPNG